MTVRRAHRKGRDNSFAHDLQSTVGLVNMRPIKAINFSSPKSSSPRIFVKEKCLENELI